MDYQEGNLEKCPRCKGAHAKLRIRRFASPVVCRDVVYTHWALCPKTKEPILHTRQAVSEYACWTKEPLK